MRPTVESPIPGLQSLKVRLAIIQPTPFCNINCRYCYLPDRGSTLRMQPETLEHTFRFLFSIPSLVQDGFSIVWHSGEPMVLPIEYYRHAFQLLERVNTQGVKVEHRFSTNGTLINQAWCEFAKSTGLEMRVSLDGPQWLHDINRRDRLGKGTFDRVMQGIGLLYANHLPFFVNCVLTRQSLDAAEEIWHFLRKIGAQGICFCIEEILGANTSNSLEAGRDIERLKDFFTTLLHLKETQDPAYFIREIDEFPRSLAGLRSYQGGVNEQAVPFRLVTIGWDGGISTFSPELLVAQHEPYGSFVFGNVRTHSFEDIMAGAKFQRVYGDIQRGVRACRESCSHFRFCGGGGPAPKLFETGTFTSTETLSCRTKVKAIVDAITRYHALDLSIEREAGLRHAEIEPIPLR